MIQWRNFNIDPDWYFKKLRKQPDVNPFGVLELMHRVREQYPHIAYGYFNPAQKPRPTTTPSAHEPSHRRGRSALDRL